MFLPPDIDVIDYLFIVKFLERILSAPVIKIDHGATFLIHTEIY